MDNQSNQNRNQSSNLPATNTGNGSILSDFFDLDNVWGIPSLFSNTARRNVPAVNVKENDKEFDIEMAIPGIPKDKIHIDVEQNVLIVKGENTTESNNNEENGRYTRKEFSQTSFERRFTLPESVDVDKIKAKCNDGILDIQIPKMEDKQMNRRQIKLS
jgi:HSP20 family protein